jgi:DNA-directed RNA polymerase specialized sigma24 family protein
LIVRPLPAVLSVVVVAVRVIRRIATDVKLTEKSRNHLTGFYGLRSVEYRDGVVGGEFVQYALGRTALLHQSAYVLCGDWHLARDVVRETLAKAYLHWPRVQQAGDPDGYVRRIMLDEARFIAWPAAVSSAVPGTVDGIARRDSVLQALLELPFHERATVVFRYLEGLSQAETAEVLGCSQRAVRRRSYRALASLRKILDSAEAAS